MSFTNCENCKTEVLKESKFCPKCGFPEHGTLEEQETYYDDYNKKNAELNGLIDKAGSSAAIFIFIAIFSAIGALISFYLNSKVGAISSGIFAVIFLLLAFWSNKNTFAAILTGFVLFTTFVLANFLLTGGYNILHIIIVVVLGRGAYIGLKVNKLKKELKDKH